MSLQSHYRICYLHYTKTRGSWSSQDTQTQDSEHCLEAASRKRTKIVSILLKNSKLLPSCQHFHASNSENSSSTQTFIDWKGELSFAKKKNKFFVRTLQWNSSSIPRLSLRMHYNFSLKTDGLLEIVDIILNDIWREEQLCEYTATVSHLERKTRSAIINYIQSRVNVGFNS